MGFFSNLLSAAAPIVSGLLGVQPPPTAVQPASAQPALVTPQTVSSLLGPSTAVGRPAIRTVAGVLQDPTARGRLATQLATAGLTGTGGAAVGNGAVFTRTVIQRISRADGTVLSEQIKAGSPFLMNSEVRSLRRVTKMINKAHGKVPRKTARVSEDMLNDAVADRLQQLNQAQCLVGNNGCK